MANLCSNDVQTIFQLACSQDVCGTRDFSLFSRRNCDIAENQLNSYGAVHAEKRLKNGADAKPYFLTALALGL